MDITLLMTNASQLKALLEVGQDGQQFYHPLIVLIIISVIIQLVTAIILMVLGAMTVKPNKKNERAELLNNLSVGFMLAITVINTFISAFGMKLTDVAASNDN